MTTTKTYLAQFLVLSVALTMAIGANYLYAAWSGPTATPPGGNVAPPINTSATAQTKTGDLTVAGLTSDVLSVLGNSSIVGKLRIGASGTPAQLLDLRGTDGVDGIRFPNGSVQTVAYDPANPNVVFPQTVTFECFMIASDTGCTGVAYCPAGSTITGLKAVTKNSYSFVTASEYSAGAWNTLTAANATGNGIATVSAIPSMNQLDASASSKPDMYVVKNGVVTRDISSAIGYPSLYYHCHGNDGGGNGECHIRGEIVCNI